MRWATLVFLTLLGCSDLREFRGAWHGHRVGDADVLHTNVAGTAAALTIEALDGHSFAGRLTIDALLADAPIASMPGAEADALAGLTFDGDPLRVYLAFAPIADGHGDALVVIALFDDHRIEVRLMRGGAQPLYGIFALTEGAAP
ncbi:MAG TPA: hypothetical protein VGC42_14745 [Kofleriaceae bacterium]